MQVRLWVALIVAWVLVFSTSAIAGPKIPNWGDPDIVEGIRPDNPTPQDFTFDQVGCSITINPFGLRVVVVDRQEHPRKLRCSKKSLPAIGFSSRIRSGR